MKPARLFFAAALISCAGCAGGLKFAHTPPGTSVEVALARKAELVRMPGVPEPENTVQAVHYVAAKPDPTAMIAEAYSRGEFCMKAGADQEAIVAFREVVKLDANFSDAWRNLAVLYERQGDDEKALEAFRKSKKAGQ